MIFITFLPSALPTTSRQCLIVLAVLQSRGDIQSYTTRHNLDVCVCVCACVCVCDDLYPVKESRGIKVKVKSREFQKNMYFCFIDYAEAFDCVDHNKPENS